MEHSQHKYGMSSIERKALLSFPFVFLQQRHQAQKKSNKGRTGRDRTKENGQLVLVIDNIIHNLHIVFNSFC